MGRPSHPAGAERLALADQRFPVWQRQEAEDCDLQGLWFAAVWHLDRLVAENPDDARLAARRAAARDWLAEEQRQRRAPELPAEVFAK